MTTSTATPATNGLDIGLGTAYERVAIYSLFDRWSAGLNIARACEGPVDGMAGIPGLHLLGFARRGVDVTVCAPTDAELDRVRAIYRRLGVESRLTTKRVEPDAMPSGSYDALVCYNALPFADDWRRHLANVFRADARWFFIVVSNPASYGTYLRRAQRLIRGETATDLFDHEATRRELIEPELAAHGRIASHDYLDCPWWPDFLIPARGNLAGEALAKVRGVFGKSKSKGEYEARWVFGEAKYPFFEGEQEYAQTMRSLRVHPTFDRAPEPVARFFGHLHGYLVEKP